MTLPFPAIRCPARRTFKPGTYPVRQFVSQNGATTTVIRGDRISGSTISIEYPLIRDAEVVSVLTLWQTSFGGFRDVALPADAFEGADPDLVATIPSYLRWFMDEPEVRSVQPGLSSLTLNFTGRLAA